MRLTRPSARLAIPKIIHHIWIGDDPLPKAAQDMRDTWRRHHPEWQMRLWTQDNLPPMQNEALYYRSRNTGHRADILRYELLRQFGGIYVDMDMECQRPLDDLIKDCEGFAGRIQPTRVETCTQYLEIAILGSIPAHPLFAQVLDRIAASFVAHESESVSVRTGPQFFQPQYLAWRTEGEQYRGEHRDFLLFRPSLFYPYTWVEREDGRERGADMYPEACAIHRWWGTWEKQPA